MEKKDERKMAEAMTSEVMHKKEGKVGMTKLTFRSKQYTFPSLIVKPESQTGMAAAEAENICVLLDVGLFCPFCTGTFTAKFVRSHGRLALNKQGRFELTDQQAIQEAHPGQLMLTPEQAAHACCNQHGAHPEAQDSDNDSDLGLKSNVEKEFNESGIHVHITPHTAGEQQKYARIVPLAAHQHPHHHHPKAQQASHHHHSHSHQQHQHHHRHHHTHGSHHPREARHQEHSKHREADPVVLERQKFMKQNLKQQHRERQLQIRQQQARYLQSVENNQKRMAQLKAGQVYVEQKSSQYVIKHDLSKKHKRAPPPPPPKHSIRRSTSSPGTPSTPRSNSSPAPDQWNISPEQRKRRSSSVDRQEIIYEGENIALGGCIETNLDDFSQIVTSRERQGEIRTPPVKPRKLPRNPDVTPDRKNPKAIDPYRVIAKRKRRGHGTMEKQNDENQNVVHKNVEVVTNERTDTMHESLEKLSPTRTSQHAPWASDNDIYRQPLPVNRLAKQIPPKVPPRIRRPDQQTTPKQSRPMARSPYRDNSETRSTTSEDGRSSMRSRSNSETEQENWIKISKVPRGSPAPETLGPVVEPVLNESQELRRKELTNTRQMNTDERIRNYIGEQAAINRYNRDQTDVKVIPRSSRLQRSGTTSPVVQENINFEVDTEVKQPEEHLCYDGSAMSPDDIFENIRRLNSNEDHDSDTTSDEADDVFEPEDTVDMILENVDTETYSPSSTLSRAFTGPRGKKKKKKPVADPQPPLETQQEESELHQAVAQIVEKELRTPSPETVLDEILEGVDDEETVPDTPDWDTKHSKTTTASMNTTTKTTYTSHLLHQMITAPGQTETDDHEMSESPERESLESTLTKLNAKEGLKNVSPSTSCECLPEEGGDNVSVGRSTYDGYSEYSENEEGRDSESPGYLVSQKKPGSETSIERIIDKTLFLTDKILAAYPEIEQQEKMEDSTLASVATQSSLSDCDEFVGTEESQEEDAELQDIVSEEIDKAMEEERSKQDTPSMYGTYVDLDKLLTSSEEEQNSFRQESFDSQLSVRTESDFIDVDFHSSEAYTPPSLPVRSPTPEKKASPVVTMEEMIRSRALPEVDPDDDTVAKSLLLDKVTRDLYDIQHSLASEGETWLIEDFYQDTEFTEMESMSDQGTMEKKRLSRQLVASTSVDKVEEESIPAENVTQGTQSEESESDAPTVPRKVQFWVPQRERGTETEEEDDLDNLETFEEVEERLREMEQTVKELGAMDRFETPTSDLDQETPSKEDLREVDDDQYNSEHTTEDLDQLESSCNEDVGSEIDDVIEALMMEEQFGHGNREIVESETEVKKSPEDQVTERKRSTLCYLSPISTSGSESEPDDDHPQCDDQVSEVTVANADTHTLMQDVVKRDNMQRSEVCITYVNVDGSSSDSITDTFVDESDESVIFVNKSSLLGSADSVKLREVEEELKEDVKEEQPESDVTTIVNVEHTDVGSSTTDTQYVTETHVSARKEIKPIVVIDKSSESSSEESDADSEKDFENIYNSYSSERTQQGLTLKNEPSETTSSVVKKSEETQSLELPSTENSKYEIEEVREVEVYKIVDTEIVERDDEIEIKEHKVVQEESTSTIEEKKDHFTVCVSDPEASIAQEVLKDEDKENAMTKVEKPIKVEDSGSPDAVKSVPSAKTVSVRPETKTNVATYESEDVLSKEQAQEFLKHMFGANHAEGHKKETEDLEACLSDVCQAVAENDEDYEVKEEEVSTQEITLIFAWPRNKQMPIKRYDEPFREIHLRRVTRIKDFGIEVVEGPTVTTIERPGVPAIADDQPTTGDHPKLPNNDSIVVSQKRKETVTKRVLGSQEETTTGKTDEEKVEKSDDEDEGSSCGRPLSSDVEVDLEELLGGISDVSESFDFGGEKFINLDKRDASSQTEGLSPDSCTWSDDQSSLLGDCTDEEACFSSTGEGEQCTDAHTGAQSSMSANTQHRIDINNPHSSNTHSHRTLHMPDASTQTGGGYLGGLASKDFGINAHGSSVNVESVDASGIVEYTLASTPSIMTECTSVAAPRDKTNQSTSVTSSTDSNTASLSNLSKTVSTSMCVNVLPSFQNSVPCSAGSAYIKPTDCFMKSEGLIGQCLQARESGNQLLLVAMGDSILDNEECELSDRDPGFSILHMGQGCCARSPFFDRVTLMDQIDTNIYNCADILELENTLMMCTATTLQLVTQGILECIEPFPSVEAATWTDCLEFGMASPNFKGFLHSSADSFENACLKHPGDKLDVCAEESTIKTNIFVPEISEMQTNESFSDTKDTRAYFAEVAFAGSENMASYEAMLNNEDVKYGNAFQNEELAAWMLNIVLLTMFTPRGNKRLEKEIANIDLRSFSDVKTGIKYARPECTPMTTSVDTIIMPAGNHPYFCAEISAVDSVCLSIGQLSPGVCISNAASKPKRNLSLAVDILTCDVIHGDYIGYLPDGVYVDSEIEVPSFNQALRNQMKVNFEEIDLYMQAEVIPDAPQDGQTHPKDTNDGKEGGSQRRGNKSEQSQGGSRQSGSSSSGGHGLSYGGGISGGGASGGSGGGGDDDPWERRSKRPHEQDQKQSPKKDKKSESTDDESDEEDGYGTVVRADVVRGNGKRRSGAYSVEKVVQHISFKPIGMENKTVEMQVSPPPEIVIPVVRMSAPADEAPLKIPKSPVLTAGPAERAKSAAARSADIFEQDLPDVKNVEDFQDMVQKMWTPMEKMMTPPPHFHPMTGKEEKVVEKSMQYEFKSTDGTHVKEAWSSKEDSRESPPKGGRREQRELPSSDQSREKREQKVLSMTAPPPVVEHQVKLPRKDIKDEHVYATVRQSARMPQYSSQAAGDFTRSDTRTVAEDRMQPGFVVTKDSQSTSSREKFHSPEIDPEGILQSFRKRASREDALDTRKETVSSSDGQGRHHTMVEVTPHDDRFQETVETSTVSQESYSHTGISREMRGAQGGAGEHRQTSASVGYTEEQDVQRHQDSFASGNIMRSNSSDGVISGRPPLPPSRRRWGDPDLGDQDPMKLFPILQYLSEKEAEEFLRRVNGNSIERQTNQSSFNSQKREQEQSDTRYQHVQQRQQENLQQQHHYTAAKPLYHAQTAGTTNTFDNILNCRPIHPISKIAFCAQEAKEEAPLTNFGCIDMVASYDATEDESSCYSDTTGYSDDEFLSRQSRSAASMSDAYSDQYSGADDGTLKIYHDGKLVAQVSSQSPKRETKRDERWLYKFPSHDTEGEQRWHDGTLASIDRNKLQTIPSLEKVSPVVKHESSKAFIDDSTPGQYSEERYNTKVIQQDLGNQGSLTGMHASSFTHTKTGSWEEDQSQGSLPLRLQGVQREKTREESHSSRQREVGTLQDKYEDVVENLKRRILGFGRQQPSIRSPTHAYVEYPASTIDTSTHGSRDSSITGASSVTGTSSVSSLSTTSDRKWSEGPDLQFPGGVRGADGVLRVYYDEDIISDIKNTLHASVGTRMRDDGKILYIYHEGTLVAEIRRRQEMMSPDSELQPQLRHIPQPMPPPYTQAPSMATQRVQSEVHSTGSKYVTTGTGRPPSDPKETIYVNDDRSSVTESISIGSDTEDEYFFEEYTVEHKVPVYEDLPAAAIQPGDKVTGVFSYYKKGDEDGSAPPKSSYLERMEQMRKEKEFKSMQAKERMKKLQQPEIQRANVVRQDVTKTGSVTVSKPAKVQLPKPKLKPKPKLTKVTPSPDPRSQYMKNRPLPEVPRDFDEMSVSSTGSWQTEDTESTITGRAIDLDSAERYKHMYEQYQQYQAVQRRQDEEKLKTKPTKVPPVPPPRKHKKIPPMSEYIQQKENIPISRAEAVMKDALRKIDDMYASLTQKKTVPKYARKKPAPQQQPKIVDPGRMELIEEVKRHLSEIRSQSSVPMTPEYKAELTREIKRRIYESRMRELRPTTESAGQRWLQQTKKTRDFDEVSEAESTSSWCTVASGSTMTSQVAPFGEVTVIVEPNTGTDPRRSRRRVTEASYRLHQSQTSDDDHSDTQYLRRTMPRQQLRRPDLPPVQEYEDPRVLQEMQRRQQILEEHHRQEQFRRSTEIRRNYHTITSDARHLVQQRQEESPYDVPQLEERAPSPDPIYIEHVELQEIARHNVGQTREESPSPEPIYIEQVELQEIARHDTNSRAGTLDRTRDNRTSWGGQPSMKMLEPSGRSGSMPVLDDDLYDNMVRMLSGVAQQQEEQVYDNLPGHEGETATPSSLSPTNEPDNVTRQKTEEYLQSAYKFINEGTYDYLQDPDATPKVRHRTQSFDALDTTDDSDTMRKEVHKRRRAVSQSELSAQETLPIRGQSLQRQIVMVKHPEREGRGMTVTHGSFPQGAGGSEKLSSSYQVSNRSRSLSQDRLSHQAPVSQPVRQIDYKQRSSSLPPGMTSQQMMAEGSNQIQRSSRTTNRSMTLPQKEIPKAEITVHRDAEGMHQQSSKEITSQRMSAQSSHQQFQTQGARSTTRPSFPPPPPKLSTIQQNLPLGTTTQRQQQLQRQQVRQQQLQQQEQEQQLQQQRQQQQLQQQQQQQQQQRHQQQQWQQQQQSMRTSRSGQFQSSQMVGTQQRESQRQMSAPPDDQRFYKQAEMHSAHARSSSADRLQQRQFSTGASGEGQASVQTASYQRPHSAQQQSYHSTIGSSQQAMRSRTSSAGSTMSSSTRASTDRLVIERPDELVTRERPSSASSCASSIPQVDLDALDQLLVEIGAENYATPEISAEEDDGTYATIPAHAELASDRRMTLDSYKKSDKCAGVPLFPVTDIPPELKLQTHPRFQKRDRDEMLMCLEEVRQKAKVEKHSRDEVQIAYRSELKKFINNRETVAEDIYAKPMIKDKRPKGQTDQKLESITKQTDILNLSKGAQPHYQPLNIKIHPKITQTSNSLQKQRSYLTQEKYPHEEWKKQQILQKPTISQIHEHRKKMKPVLEAIKHTTATRNLQTALNQMQQQEQIQSQFDKAAKFTEMYSRSSKPPSHKKADQRRTYRQRQFSHQNISRDTHDQSTTAHNFRRAESFDPTSVDLFIDDDGDYAQLQVGATVDTYRSSNRQDSQSSVPLVRVTPPTPTASQPVSTSRSQQRTAMRTAARPQSKGQHQAPVDSQLAAITEESSVSDSSNDCKTNEQSTKRKPPNECLYDNTLNTQWSTTSKQINTTNVISSNEHAHILSHSDRLHTQPCGSNIQQDSVIGSNGGKSVQSVLNVGIVPFSQQSVSKGITNSRQDSVHELVGDMEDYYTTHANEGLGSSLVPSTFAHAGNSESVCALVSSVQSVSHLPMACLKPTDDTSSITPESSEESSSEIYLWCPPGKRQGIVIKGFIREQICYKYFDACVHQDLVGSCVELNDISIDAHHEKACRNSRSFETPRRFRLSRNIPSLPSQHFMPVTQFEVVECFISKVYYYEPIYVAYVYDFNSLTCRTSQHYVQRYSLCIVSHQSKETPINETISDCHSAVDILATEGNDEQVLNVIHENCSLVEVEEPFNISGTEQMNVKEKAEQDVLESVTETNSHSANDTSVSPTNFESVMTLPGEGCVLSQTDDCLKEEDSNREAESATVANTPEDITTPREPVMEESITSEEVQSLSSTFCSEIRYKSGSSDSLNDDLSENPTSDGEASDSPSHDQGLYSYSSESAISDMFSDEEQQVSSRTCNSDSEVASEMTRRTETLPEMQGMSTSDPTLSDADRHYIDYMSHLRRHNAEAGLHRANSDPFQISSESAIGDMYRTSSSENEFPSVSDMYQRIMSLTRSLDATIEDVINGSQPEDTVKDDGETAGLESDTRVLINRIPDEVVTTSSMIQPEFDNRESEAIDSEQTVLEDEPDSLETYVVGIIERAHATAMSEIQLVDIDDEESSSDGTKSSTSPVEFDVVKAEKPDVSEIDNGHTVQSDLPFEFWQSPVVEIIELEVTEQIQSTGNESKDIGEQDRIDQPDILGQTLDQSDVEVRLSMTSSPTREDSAASDLKPSDEIVMLESNGASMEGTLSPEPCSSGVAEISSLDSDLFPGLSQDTDDFPVAGSTDDDRHMTDVITAYNFHSAEHCDMSGMPNLSEGGAIFPNREQSLVSNVLDTYTRVSMTQDKQTTPSQIEEDPIQPEDLQREAMSRPPSDRPEGSPDMTDYISIGSDLMQMYPTKEQGKYQLISDQYHKYLDYGRELLHSDEVDEPRSLSNVSTVSDTASESSSSTSSSKSSSSWGSQETVIENPSFKVQYVKGVALKKIEISSIDSKRSKDYIFPDEAAIHPSNQRDHPVEATSRSLGCCSSKSVKGTVSLPLLCPDSHKGKYVSPEIQRKGHQADGGQSDTNTHYNSGDNQLDPNVLDQNIDIDTGEVVGSGGIVDTSKDFLGSDSVPEKHNVSNEENQSEQITDKSELEGHTFESDILESAGELTKVVDYAEHLEEDTSHTTGQGIEEGCERGGGTSGNSIVDTIEGPIEQGHIKSGQICTQVKNEYYTIYHTGNETKLVFSGDEEDIKIEAEGDVKYEAGPKYGKADEVLPEEVEGPCTYQEIVDKNGSNSSNQTSSDKEMQGGIDEERSSPFEKFSDENTHEVSDLKVEQKVDSGLDQDRIVRNENVEMPSSDLSKQNVELSENREQSYVNQNTSSDSETAESYQKRSSSDGNIAEMSSSVEVKAGSRTDSEAELSNPIIEPRSQQNEDREILENQSSPSNPEVHSHSDDDLPSKEILENMEETTASPHPVIHSELSGVYLEQAGSVDEHISCASFKETKTSSCEQKDRAQVSLNDSPLKDLIIFSDSDHGSVKSPVRDLMIFSDSDPENVADKNKSQMSQFSQCKLIIQEQHQSSEGMLQDGHGDSVSPTQGDPCHSYTIQSTSTEQICEPEGRHSTNTKLAEWRDNNDGSSLETEDIKPNCLETTNDTHEKSPLPEGAIGGDPTQEVVGSPPVRTRSWSWSTLEEESGSLTDEEGSDDQKHRPTEQRVPQRRKRRDKTQSRHQSHSSAPSRLSLKKRRSKKR